MGCSPQGPKESDMTDFTFTFHFHALKEMATHSSVLAWRIPGMAEPGGLWSVGSQSWTQLKRLSSSSRYAEDTTLMAESEEELKSLDERERGE